MTLPPTLKIIRGCRYKAYQDFPQKRCGTCAHYKFSHKCLKYSHWLPSGTSVMIQNNFVTVCADWVQQFCEKCVRYEDGVCKDVYTNNPSKGKGKEPEGMCQKDLFEEKPDSAGFFFISKEIRDVKKGQEWTSNSGDELITMLGECTDLKLEIC